jgi:hypothetical protein
MSNLIAAGTAVFSNDFRDVPPASTVVEPFAHVQHLDMRGVVLAPQGTVFMSLFRYTTELDKPKSDADIFDVLDELIGSIEAPEDWSSEHNHYLYNTPKSSSANANE